MDKEKVKCKVKSSGGCIYFLGFIGAATYYLGSTEGFWVGAVGLLKALVWPAFMAYEILKFVGA